MHLKNENNNGYHSREPTLTMPSHVYYIENRGDAHKTGELNSMKLAISELKCTRTFSQSAEIGHLQRSLGRIFQREILVGCTLVI
jgi:hypothetical protein